MVHVFKVESGINSETSARNLKPTDSSDQIKINPNPTSGQTKIQFTLGNAEHVRISVYNQLGIEIYLINEGMHKDTDLECLNNLYTPAQCKVQAVV